MIKGNRDYIQPFKRTLVRWLKSKKETENNLIFYVIYKDCVKKFIIDFNGKSLIFIVHRVLNECLLLALDNNCDLEDLIITERGDLIII
jgi:hypothetical protein